MTGAELRLALRERRNVFGTFLFLCRNPRWARVLGQLGLDFVIVDNEHAPYSRSETADLIDTLERAGTAPLVRVPTPAPHWVTMALDAGAHGVLVPYVETPEQVRGIVGAARFRPLKGELLERALGAGGVDGEIDEDTWAYLSQANARTVVMIGVESAPAVERLDELLAVGGVDAVHVGPHDLSVSLGVPGQLAHETMHAAFEQILATCERHEVAVAIWPLDRAAAADWMKRGMRCVIRLTDSDAMAAGYRDDLAALRNG